MDSREEVAISSLLEYANLETISIDIDSDPLGIGEDGVVWESSRNTAVKAFYRFKNYDRELSCYLRLRDFCITEIAGFSVPELVGSHDDLLVIEMGLVSPPRLLDFGKAYLDFPADYPEGVLEDHLENRSHDYSEEHWELVLQAFYDLMSYGIYYYDLRPANIQVCSE